MRTYPKYPNGGTNGRCYLIQMLQTSPRDCFLTLKKILLTIVTSIKNNSPKHLGLFLEAKLNFSEHINEKIKKQSDVLM